MKAKPGFPRPRVGRTVAAVVFSAIISIGLLSAVAGLLQRYGAPYEQLVAAELACANYAYALRLPWIDP